MLSPLKNVKTSEAYEKTVKGSICTKWVDVDKSRGVGKMLFGSRLEARDSRRRVTGTGIFSVRPRFGTDEVHAFPAGDDQKFRSGAEDHVS